MILDTNFTNSNYKEIIAHMIDSRPYSIHQTSIASSNNLVLYQHWHDEIEFFYLEQGEIEFIIEDKHFCIHEGDAVLIPPNLLHMAIKRIKRYVIFLPLYLVPFYLLSPSQMPHMHVLYNP